MGLTVSLVMAGALSPVLADDATPAATAAATAAPTPAPPAVVVDGLVDAYYSYDFNKNNAGGGNGYFYNNVDNSFTLGLAEAKLTATQGAASAHLVLAYGQETALGLTAGSNGVATGLGFDVLQGYLAYTAGQFTFTGGKFVTWMGNEVIESTGNWNYSHSLLFGVIPFWHTGLSINYTPSSTFNVTGYAVDGNNTVNSSADGKTYGLEAVLAPSAQWSFTFNGLLGPTAGNATVPNNLTNGVGELIVKFLPDSMWSFGLDGQYAMTSLSSGSTSYWGLALYGRDQISGDWAAALRLEDLSDSGELGIGSSTTAASFYEGTLTVEHDFTAALLGRLEGRYDTNSNGAGAGTTTAAPIYAGAGATSQFTLTYSTVLTF